ncbi:hypothetical protein [Trichloromonas sp.]|uniref:hypothetical protein n=1 Tax=Trichloromonas sp. TaxID=3069249 RepID=UPI002A4BAF47|nr:hypothetical protein [Trichloromonas sp.]
MTRDQVKQTLLGEGFPASSIDSFLSMIDLPEGGDGLDRILSPLPELLDKVESFGHYYRNFQPDRQWVDMATTLASLMQAPTAATQRGKKRSPLWGLFEKNAVYVAIWTVLQGEREVTTAYLELLAHEVIAASIIREKAEKNAEYRNVLVTAPGALRKAFETDTSLSGIDLHCDPTVLRKEILNSSLAEVLAPVCTLLSYIYTKAAPRREGGERRTTTYRHRLTSRPYDDLGLDEEQLQGTTQITLISRRREDPDEEEKLLAEGEISHYPDMIAASEPRQQLQSLTQQILHTQRAARTALTNRNQALPHHWQGLTQNEVMRFWDAIDWLSRNQTSNSKTTNPNDVLATTMATMLFCGKSVNEVADMRIYHGDPPDHPRSGLLHRHGQWYWVSVPYSVDYGDETPKGTCLILPLPQCTHAVFQHLALSYSDTIGALTDISALQTDIQTIITGINKKYGTRLTRERVSHYLFEQVQKQEGADVASAMYITGKSAYLGTVVSHYTRQTGIRLTSIYIKVWEGIFPAPLEDHPGKNLPQNPDIGSSRVPKRETVQSLVAQLRQQTCTWRDFYAGNKDHRNLIQYHNALTRYTAIFIAYATGIRAVTHPFPDGENIDHETGFCVISDKDSDDRYHTRLVWLPPDCHRQYLLYRNHSKLVASIMANVRNDFFTRAQDRFFFLDENGSPAAITPKRLYDFSDLPTPITIAENGNRHMLRSWLLVRGASPEVINAYLGHWFLGEEPWAQHSALSPHQYRLSLSTHVQELLDHLGFEPIEGVAKND